MTSRSSLFPVISATLFVLASAVQAQTLTSLPAFDFDHEGPVIRAHAEPEKPFTVAGERGVVVGQQDGTFEAWLLPVKLLSHLSIEAEVEGYTVPIDVNRQAAQVEVRPDRTVVTYGHIGFTVRQIMFSPNSALEGTGPLVLFQFDCVHPTNFTFRFAPELRWMWPARNEGVPGAEWVSSPGGGYYVLHSDYPDLAGAVTIPGAQPGILAPYQERPQVHPVELKLHIDPARDGGRLFPLLMAVGSSPGAAQNQALGTTLARLNAQVATEYQTLVETYKKLLANSTSIETPDKALNEAFQWATISIEQLRARALPSNETALVAGYYASGDSARPGFGWFFGRDALYTLYAVNGYGDFALSKAELEFLIRRQRADGKIMHEYSQTAELVDWKSFPYMYAAADATPLFLLAVADYVHFSGDLAFLKEHRDAIEQAWAFETAHAPGPEQGGDGVYDNQQGTGWVESWPGAMPRQEIYLALLDQQASAAVAQLETLLGDTEKASVATKRAAFVAKAIDSEYYDPAKGCYAFSRNAGGTMDRTTTVYPALAWWSGPATIDHPEGCLKEFARHSLRTDWGLRDVSSDEKMFDGMSYHQGSVWPLFTGWAALAEYRGNQPLAGFQMLMENANLTKAQDLGAVTELLSGDFFVPFGRSTSHQLWSSAMVITPTLRGLFGIDVDAQQKVITLNPHLPAGWDHASVRNIQVPGGNLDIDIRRTGDGLIVHLVDDGNAVDERAVLGHHWNMTSDQDFAMDKYTNMEIHLPEVEVGDFDHDLTQPGARTSRARVISEERKPNQLTLTVEGMAGSEIRCPVYRRKPVKVKAEVEEHFGDPAKATHAAITLSDPAASLRDPKPPLLMTYHFPAGEGWKTMKVTLCW